MNDHNKDLHSLWKNQSTQIGDVDVELVRKNALKFERAIKLTNLREAAAGIFVTIMFTKMGLEQESLFRKIASFEIAFAGIFVTLYMYYYSMKNRIQEDGSNSLDHIEKYKHSLNAQIKLLGSVRYWYVLPIALGLFALDGYEIYKAIQGKGDMTSALISLGISIALGIFVIWLNEYKAVKDLKRELESLN
jgi:hypothetical protein